MRVLILSCNTGEGHNSAAKAIKECFDRNFVECDIMDCLAFWSPKMSEIVSAGHVFFYKNMPKLYGAGYRFEEQHPPKDGGRLNIDLARRAGERVYQLIQAKGYGAVICTHVFAAILMTSIKKRHGYTVKSYFVATDYTCSPGVASADVDVFFIPHEKLIPEFIKCGVKEERIAVSGIPVRAAFYKERNRLDAIAELKLPADKRHVLMMSGSMGCGPIAELAKTLSDSIPKDTYMTVICGRNKKICDELIETAGSMDNMRVVGFSDKIPEYMDASELIITKPGGLSSTEAAAKNLPMVFVEAVPGCETHNLDFFVSNGFAYSGVDTKAIAERVIYSLSVPDELNNMRARLRDAFRDINAPQMIYSRVMGDAELE